MPAVSKAQQIAMGYIAGFFDGEGYLTIRRSNLGKARNPAYRLVLGFTNTDLTVLEWIRGLIGSGCINAKARKSMKHSLAWELTIHRKVELELVLREILPIVRIKKKQVEIALAFLSLGNCKMVHIPRGKTWPLRIMAPGELEKRESYKAQMTEANRRGPCQP